MIAQRVRDVTAGRADTLVENSVYGVGITVVNSVVGFAYWIVAARLFTTDAVGVASALISAMTLASAVSNLGVGSGLVQRLPRRADGDDWSLTLNTTALVGAATGLGASLVGLLAVPLLSGELRDVLHRPAYASAFVIGTVLWTLSFGLDFVFVAERKVKFGFVRNCAFAGLKLGLLATFAIGARDSALGLYGSWVLGTGLALVVGLGLLPKLQRHWRPVLRGAGVEARSMMNSLVKHHVINVGSYLPMYVLPLVVTARLGVTENAWAYVGWMVGSFALVASPTVAASLFAEGSHDPASLKRQARRSLVIILALCVPALVAVPLLGRPILGVFGPEYAAHSYALVLVLVLSAIPDAITNVFVAVLRVRGQLGAAASLNAAMAIGAVVLAWFFVDTMGIVGIGWAWLVAQTLGGVVALAATLHSRVRR